MTPYRGRMTVPTPGPVPPLFAAAAEELRAALAEVRPDVLVREVPAPTRVAPHAVAFAAEVVRDGEETGAARLVLLHDPQGQESWEGTLRFVGYARAELEPAMTPDPLLPEVTWSWLHESLDDQGVGRRAVSGTVTTTTSTRFGALAGADGSSELELRCSWSPDGDGLGRHLLAVCELLACMLGLPPLVPGVSAIGARRTADVRG